MTKIETNCGNPYILCGELEASLNRNQRDVLDYFMINYSKRENGVQELITDITYILENYDGVKRLSDDEIEDFWANQI